jgi:sigma-B regulation protein RsbU (phosphoserine phosphatase)
MARQFATPGEILRRLNAELVAQNPLCMFVSIICLIFDLKTGWVFCANAGHNPPVFTGADGKPRFVFSSTGKIAGIDEDLGIKTETLSLEPGDSLVLYTDGVTEAFDEQKRMFDNDGLLKCLKGANSRSAAQTVSRLREAVDKQPPARRNQTTSPSWRSDVKAIVKSWRTSGRRSGN